MDDDDEAKKPKPKKAAAAPRRADFAAIKNFFKLNPRFPDELLVMPFAKIEELVRFRLEIAENEMKLAIDVDGEPFTNYKWGRARIQLRVATKEAEEEKKQGTKRKADASLEDIAEEEEEDDTPTEVEAPPGAEAPVAEEEPSKPLTRQSKRRRV